METDNDPHWTEGRAFWISAALFVAAFYFFGLTIPLVGPDEPRYAQVAREMWQAGDWITPTLGGYHWFEKPVLLYWLQIASYHLFGATEFAARFGSALFGLGSVASVWLLGRAVDKDLKGFSFANLLAMVAASTIGIIVFSRGASFDIILTFPISAALACYFVYDRSEQTPARRSVSAIFGFYFFVGVALLAKGLVGLVFPYAIVGFYHLLSRRWPSRTTLISLFWGTLLAAAVASAWYVPMYIAHGWPFIDEFFIQHHFQRYTSNKYFHPQPFYFFFWVLPLMTIPWLPFFFAGLWSGLRALMSGESASTPSSETPHSAIRTPQSNLLIFCLAWLLVPLAFFSFSGSKLPGYILPSVPPAIVIAAICVQRFIGSSIWKRTLIIGLAAATFAVIAILLITVVPSFADDDSVKRLIAEADARGYKASRILSLHGLTHNAEFYAAGRLLRTPDGKQKRLFGDQEVLDEIWRHDGEPVLVLVPNEWVERTAASPLIRTEAIASNAEWTIIAARTP